MPPSNTLEQCEAMLVALRANLMATLGPAAVDFLLLRALAEVSHTYPALALIGWRGNALSFDELDKEIADHPDGEISAAFGALTGVLLLITSRILGKTMARQLAGKSTAADSRGGYWLGD